MCKRSLKFFKKKEITLDTLKVPTQINIRDQPQFQEAVEAKKKPKEKNLINDLPIPVSLNWHEIQGYEQAFKDFDQNGDGIITVDELPEVLESIGLKPSPEEVSEMVAKVDINNDGIIDICEFIRMMSLQQNPMITPESQLEDIFEIFDQDNIGFMTMDVLRQVMLSLAHPVSEDGLDDLMKRGDRRGEGRLTKKDFIRMMMNKFNLKGIKGAISNLRDQPEFQEAVEAKKKPKDKDFLKELPIPVSLSWHEIQGYEQAFKDFDQNGDGIITVDELPEVLECIGLKPSAEEVAQMVSVVDINNDGIIDICEFIRMMSLQQNPQITPERQLEDLFEIFDKDACGFMTKDVLRQVMLSLAHPVSEDGLDDLMKRGDRRGEGRLSKNDFIRMMMNKCKQNEDK
ncbi:uncharacterized protein LOC134821110 [Bolinopsis microptera]|uniref:uncharacterized protein LOC134821110 n=1 Tax=Bolinopsis microptera TaxID=2820187 RepID=UPI00307965AB